MRRKQYFHQLFALEVTHFSDTTVPQHAFASICNSHIQEEKICSEHQKSAWIVTAFF